VFAEGRDEAAQHVHRAGRDARETFCKRRAQRRRVLLAVAHRAVRTAVGDEMSLLDTSSGSANGARRGQRPL